MFFYKISFYTIREYRTLRRKKLKKNICYFSALLNWCCCTVHSTLSLEMEPLYCTLHKIFVLWRKLHCRHLGFQKKKIKGDWKVTADVGILLSFTVYYRSLYLGLYFVSVQICVRIVLLKNTLVYFNKNPLSLTNLLRLKKMFGGSMGCTI